MKGATHHPYLWLSAAVAAFLMCAARAGADTPQPAALAGIGAVLSTQNGIPTVMDLVPGAAAQREGELKVGDQVMAVAQGNDPFVDCTGLSLAEVTAMIRGKSGTPVRLKVKTGDGSAKEIALVRASIHLGGVAAAASPATSPAGSISQESDAALKAISDAARKSMLEDMQKQVADIATSEKLDDAHKKLLEAAAEHAVDDSLAKLKEKLPNLIQHYANGPHLKNFLQNIVRDPSLAKAFAFMTHSQSGVSPEEEPAWNDGLKQALNADQLAAWNARQAKRKAAVEQQIGGYLKGVNDFCRMQVKAQIDQKISVIEIGLPLPPEQLKKLHDFEEKEAARQGQRDCDDARQALMKYSDQQREAALKMMGMGGFYQWLVNNPDDHVDQKINDLLTKEEQAQLRDLRNKHKAMRASAMGKLLVTLLDERMAFTAAQRQQLEPMAGKMVSGESNLMDDIDPNNYLDRQLTMFYSIAFRGYNDQIKAILDPDQQHEWHDAGLEKPDPNSDNTYHPPPPLPSPADANKVEPPLDAEGQEAAISDFLAKCCDQHRKSTVADCVLKAEDAARVTHLSLDRAARLRTAARGTAEQELAGWNAMVEQNIRANLGNGPPETLKRRLAQMENEGFWDGSNDNSGNQPIWDAAVKAALSSDQQAAWKKEVDAREAYRKQAIVESILSTLDQQIDMTPQQWAKIESMLQKVMSDYAEDFASYMGANPNWFLQPYLTFMPLDGIPRKDMQRTLSDSQWKRLTGSYLYSNAGMMWGNLLQMHQQRLKVHHQQIMRF